MGNQVALVDADGLLYLAGFGVEKTHYQVVVENEKEELDVLWFDSASDIKQFMKENENLTEVDRVPHKTVGPVEHALQIAKSKLREIQIRYGGILEIYIRGDSQRNYRDDVATIAPYKGNRSNIKATHHEALREYLVENWHAYKVEDQEVDDEVGCRLTELEDQGKTAVIVTPDKDLDQLPGLHWNYRSNVEYEVDWYEAQRWFWVQVLTGDSSDNIKGCWKIGQTAAETLIDSTHSLSDEEIWEVVVNCYEKSMEHPKCPYVGMPPEQVALENAQLVYMRRYRGEIWMPPGVQNATEARKVSLDN